MNSTNDKTVGDLRDQGYCVVVFNPTELRGANPEDVADRLCELGWEVIDCLAPPSTVKVGQMYRSLRDEIDGPDPDDADAIPFLNADGERVTPAGSTWKVFAHNHADVWDILCEETGGWICPTEEELARDFVRVE